MGKNNLNIFELLKLYVTQGQFEKGMKIVDQLSPKELHDCLMEIAYEDYNLTSYSFIASLISKNETSEFHSLASDILGVPLCHLNGALISALFHARRALELNPENIEYKEWLLYFYEIPDKLILREEAIIIAKEVLQVKPESTIAQGIFE